MKKIVYTLMVTVFALSISSCASTSAMQKNNTEVGYTLKNKKELMEQKVLNKRLKTVIVAP